MTKAQVFDRYGEPFHRGRVDGQEVWYYRLKFDEVYGRALVPFGDSSDNVSIGTLTFGPQATVVRYYWRRIDVK